jgi:glycosyltransferase involved in cell wall biosynthesis
MQGLGVNRLTTMDLRPMKNSQRISLNMIVRNEEDNLPACLSSAADLFQEIVVVDTGSADRTREIARSFGAQIVDFPWTEDFSDARNAALDCSTGDYIFWLDADDRLDGTNHRRLQQLLLHIDTSTTYVMTSKSALWNTNDSHLMIDHVRLFPNVEGIRWTGRLHEQILPSLLGRVKLRRTDVVINHTGYTDRQTSQRKSDRNLRIATAELADRPDDPLVLLKLGRLLVKRGDARAAVGVLFASKERLVPISPNVWEVYYHLADAYLVLGEPESALQLCGEGLGLDPDNPSLLSQEAYANEALGRWDDAQASWQRILRSGDSKNRSEIFLTSLFGHGTRRNLARISALKGNYLEAFKLWSEVSSECPEDAEAVAARGWAARMVLLHGTKSVWGFILTALCHLRLFVVRIRSHFCVTNRRRTRGTSDSDP